MNNEEFTLLSLNIEYDVHIEHVKNLLKKTHPDIFCLQEVPLQHAADLAAMHGYEWKSVKMADMMPDDRDELLEIGLMIGWNPKFKLHSFTEDIYSEGDSNSRIWNREYSNATKRVLFTVCFESAFGPMRIGTTHFTWTSDGHASPEQHKDMTALLSLLEKFDDKGGIVFCGDFNAPRGREIYARIASQYNDNLPLEITTTIDQELHRKAPLPHVVDSIFSTKEYTVKNVSVQGGVSDHMALFAQVSKNV